MTTEEVKDFLEQKTDGFMYEVGSIPENFHKIRVEKGGQEMFIDVSKVQDKRAAKQLAKYITSKWEAYEKNKDMV